MRMLITGFEPFGGERVNPSALAAAALAREDFDGAVASFLVLPVARYRSIDLAVEAIERQRPDLVVMLGEGGGRTRLTPERVALNIDDFRIPDNAGHHPVEEPIVPGGPAAHFSTLPVRDMVRRMTAAGVPAAISNTAGTYLCNHVSYGVLHHIALRRLHICAGFVHVPYLPEQTIDKPLTTPSMSLELMLRGLRQGIAAAMAVPQPALARA